MYGKRARSGLVPVLVPVLVGGLIALTGLAACEEETNSPTAPTNAEAPDTTPGENPGEVQNVAINTTCPVGGEPVDPAVVVEYEGQTIAFCCTDCKGEWDASDDAERATIAAKARGGDAAESGGGEQTGGG